MDKSVPRRHTPKGKEYCDVPGTSCLYGPDDLCINCDRKKGWRYQGRPRSGRHIQYGNKTIYVRDFSKWDKAIEMAKAQGISVSTLIEYALERLFEPESESQDKLRRIAEILAE